MALLLAASFNVAVLSKRCFFVFFCFGTYYQPIIAAIPQGVFLHRYLVALVGYQTSTTLSG